MIWLLIVTLAVLCKRKHFKQDYHITKSQEDIHEDNSDQRQSVEAKEVFARDSIDDYTDNHVTPDVVQTVKLWYV